MSKVKAYFSRTVPFYLLSESDVEDSEGFDAYPVEVDSVALANIRSVRRLIENMETLFLEGGAPEDSAQDCADELVAEVRRIFKTKAQSNG